MNLTLNLTSTTAGHTLVIDLTLTLTMNVIFNPLSSTTAGRTLTSFKTSLEVMNYPMRKRTETEMEELNEAKFIREIELMEEDSR